MFWSLEWCTQLLHTGRGRDLDGSLKSESSDALLSLNTAIYFIVLISLNTKLNFFRGFTDFAGSAVVHLAGAVLSLPGCVILGARCHI